MNWRLISNEEIYAKLEEMHQLMQRHFSIIEQKETNLMSAVDDLQASVTAEDTVIDSAITLIKGLADALAAAGTDPAKLAALKADIDAKAGALAAAVAANTPAAP